MDADLLRRVVEAYADGAAALWPDDSYFHRRNRFKAERAVRRANDAGYSGTALVDRWVELVRGRASAGIPTLLAMSHGSSGCHFLGELVGGLDGFQLTDEIYYPAAVVERLEGSTQGGAVLDAIDLLHAGRVDDAVATTVIVNIGHLRPDARPSALRRAGSRGVFVVLLRNPYAIATSRAFRKDDYRAQVDPASDDAAYLAKQAASTKAFLHRAAAERWDVVARYEDLVADPTAVVGDLFLSQGWPFPVEAFEAVRRRYAAGTRTSASANLNRAPRPTLTPEQASMLVDTLDDSARRHGYRPTREVVEGLVAGSPPVPAERLWMPLFSSSHRTAKARQRLVAGEVKVFRRQPVVALADPPDWGADPVGSATWRLYHHSLAWLLALAWGVEHGPDPEGDRDRLVRWVMSYLDACVDHDPPDRMAWDDHAAADRLAVLCVLLAGPLRGTLDWEAEWRLLEAIRHHVTRVVGFVASGRWDASNHGVFHAMALLDAGLVLPQALQDGDLVATALEHLRRVVGNLVDEESGMCTEQSMAYHAVVLELLRSVAATASALDLDLDLDLAALCGRMVEFNLLVRGTGDRRPAIGDTAYGDRIPRLALTPRPGEPIGEHTRWVLGDGTEGEPFPVLSVHREVGLAVFRHGEVRDGSEPVTRAFLRFADQRHHHGHHDALSLCLDLDGVPVLIDSGGPYRYGHPSRFRYFMAARAHNTVRWGGRDPAGGGRLVAADRYGHVSSVVVERVGDADGPVVTRAVVDLGGRVFAVLDTADADPGLGAGETFWHLPPEAVVASVAPRAGGTVVGVAIEDTMATMQLHSTGSHEVAVVCGVEGDDEQGWVATGPGRRVPAPVLVVASPPGRLRSVAVVHRAETVVEIDAVGDDRVDVDVAGRRHQILWSPRGRVDVVDG